MKPINLIPKIPAVRKYFSLMMGGIIAVTIGTSGILTYIYVHETENIREKGLLKDRQLQRAAQLNQERTTDPTTVQYQALTKEIDVLKPTIRDWQPVFESITHSLPTEARIISMEADASEAVKLHLEMKAIPDIADYVIRLQNMELYSQVSVQSVQFKELLQPISQSASGAASAVSGYASPSAEDGARSMSYEEYTNLFRKESAAGSAGASESEELLQQLDWLMSQKISSQMNGIQLPNRSPEEIAAPPDEGPITQEDIDKAKQTLEQLQNIRITDSASGENGAVSEDATAKAGMYDVVMEVRLNPLTKEK